MDGLKSQFIEKILIKNNDGKQEKWQVIDQGFYGGSTILILKNLMTQRFRRVYLNEISEWREA